MSRIHLSPAFPVSNESSGKLRFGRSLAVVYTHTRELLRAAVVELRIYFASGAYLKAWIISNETYRNGCVQMAQALAFIRVYTRPSEFLSLAPLPLKIVFVSNLWPLDYYPISIGRLRWPPDSNCLP